MRDGCRPARNRQRYTVAAGSRYVERFPATTACVATTRGENTARSGEGEGGMEDRLWRWW